LKDEETSVVNMMIVHSAWDDHITE